MDWKTKIQNKAFWVALFSFIALTGQVFGIYTVPEGWDMWTNTILALLTAMGIIINPNTPGMRD